MDRRSFIYQRGKEREKSNCKELRPGLRAEKLKRRKRGQRDLRGEISQSRRGGEDERRGSTARERGRGGVSC